MTFESIYRDVFSRLNAGGLEHDVYHLDVLNAVNDAISSVRLTYIDKGFGQYFATTETFSTLTQDATYPYVYSTNLTYKPYKSDTVSKVVVNTVLWVTKNTLTNTLTSYNVDDLVEKNGILYKCVKTYDNLNTYAATFNNKNIRNFRQLNGISYKIGDVVLISGDYYKFVVDVTNDTLDTLNITMNTESDIVITDEDGNSIDVSTILSRVYWREVGNAHITPSYYPFSRINEMRVPRDANYLGGISFNENKLYVTKNVEKLSISYIPEWTPITTLSTDLVLSDTMVVAVKQLALDNLEKKLGKNVVDSRVAPVQQEVRNG